MLRTVVGVLLVLLMLVIGVALYAYFSRVNIVEGIIRDRLEEIGFTQIDLNVDRIEADGVILSNLTLAKGDSPSVTADKIEVVWDWQQLRQGTVEAISLKNAVLPLDFDGQNWRLGGVLVDRFRSSSDDQISALPIMKADHAELIITTPEGTGEVELTGSYDPAWGGKIDLHGRSEGILIGDVTLKTAQIDLALDLKADGSFSSQALSAADLIVQNQAIDDVTFDGQVSGTQWTEALNDPTALRASFTGKMAAPKIPVLALPFIDPAMALIAPKPATTLALTGAIHGAWNGQTLTIEEPSALTSVFDNGVTANFDGSALMTLAGPNSTKSNAEYTGKITFDGATRAPIAAMATLTTKDGSKSFSAQIAHQRWHKDDLTLVPGTLAIQGQITDSENNGAEIIGTLTIDGGIKEVTTDTTKLRNLTTQADLPFNYHPASAELTLTIPPECLKFTHPVLILGTDQAAFKNAKLCPSASSDQMIFKFSDQDEEQGIALQSSLNISAASVAGKFGETSFTGTPPKVVLDLTTRKDLATYEMVFRDGQLKLNDKLAIAKLTGTSQGRYANGKLSMQTKFSDVTLKDLSNPIMVSPLRFSGLSNTQGDMTKFDGTVKSPSGVKLGRVQGKYDAQTTSGEAAFIYGPLTFERNGLQPKQIAPALKGFVENATGESEGGLYATLTKQGLSVSAAIDLNDLTFAGPTQAVTKTGGLKLKAKFSKLVPLTTAGLQKATIDLVDLDALKLEDGEIDFHAPGDETLVIERAEWPWFSGVLGIYDTIVPFDMKNTEVKLIVDDIELSELLSFFDINGLSGEGRLKGELPLVFRNGEAEIVNGVLKAVGPGVVRYQAEALDAAAEAGGEGTKIAFGALKELHFTQLDTVINGFLAGDVDIGLKIEGKSDDVLNGFQIKYNINIEDAPFSALIRQATASQAEKRRVLDAIQQSIGVEIVTEELKNKTDRKKQP